MKLSEMIIECLSIRSLFLEGGFFEVVEEGVYAGEVGVPGEHDAGSAADEGVELPAAGSETLKDGVRGLKEDGVGFDGGNDFDVGDGCYRVGEITRALVGVAGVGEPCTAFEHADPGCGEEAHF